MHSNPSSSEQARDRPVSARPALMIQGTSSHAGKSLLTTGLCRAFARQGLKVRPFKPQNMSNNAAVTSDGGEIGRAQALQARAAKSALSVHMNPVLLKPQSGMGAQLVVQGKVVGTVEARHYHHIKHELLASVVESFEALATDADLVVAEGAGSPAEINLRAGDFANMGFALAANVPVVLAGDIERGGVIASIIGTHALLDKEERALLKGYIINKFRGDPTLFHNAHPIIEGRTGIAPLGVVPWFEQAYRLPEEDVLGLGRVKTRSDAKLKVAVPRLPRISNLDDLDPLLTEPEVAVTVLEPGTALPADIDLVLLIGSKATIADLISLREEGWDIDILAHVRRGGHVLGLCGGYQMLGHRISDPDGIEGSIRDCEGLGLLDIETVIRGPKTTVESEGKEHLFGTDVWGYQIHMGVTQRVDGQPLLTLDGVSDGAINTDEKVTGCYLHGLLANDAFRRSYLRSIREIATNEVAFDASIEQALDDLADHLEAHLDIDRLFDIAASRQG